LTLPKKGHIRSYEKKGLISPGNNKLGRRIYNQHDRARLELIFHFELIDYSLDKIAELIGIPDINLAKIEQFRKSLEYGEKKIDELEKQSKEIKFPDRIGVMNKINRMRGYAEELKNKNNYSKSFGAAHLCPLWRQSIVSPYRGFQSRPLWGRFFTCRQKI